jgi:AAA family ATP:ADP antiporter
LQNNAVQFVFYSFLDLHASSRILRLQCANDVTSLSQAKRFYPLFAVFGNLAPIVSGKVMSLLVSLQETKDDVGFQSTLQGLASIKNCVCLGIIALYHLVYDLADKRQRREEKERINEMLVNAKEGDTVEVEVTFGGKKVRKAKPTMRQSLSELSKSWELKAMATMVVCYNICIELTEVLWKALLRKTYTTKSSYMGFMATFSQTVGWVTIAMQLLAPSIIRTLGWKGSAMLVPLAMGAFAIKFFTSAAGIDGIGEAVGSASPLTTALLIGTLLNVVSKVTKYSLFDPCKEMAYIPLGPEAKVKGKAAVDVFGARLGRSIGSASQQLVMLASGGAASSIIQFVPFLGVLYMTALGFWANAVYKLGRLFDKPKVETAQPNGLSGLIRVRLDSDREKILSIEAERSSKEEYENISK